MSRKPYRDSDATIQKKKDVLDEMLESIVEKKPFDYGKYAPFFRAKLNEKNNENYLFSKKVYLLADTAIKQIKEENLSPSEENKKLRKHGWLNLEARARTVVEGYNKDRTFGPQF